MAETSMLLRLDQQLKNDFEWACAQADKTASHALRDFMRQFIDELVTKKAAHMVIEQAPTGEAQFFYNQNDPKEVMTIKKRLFLIKEFVNLHPSVRLAEQWEREQMKTQAYEKLHDKELPTSQRVDAAVDIIKAHFMRSALSSISPEHPTSINWHPGFDEYAKHYIAAEGSLVNSFSADVCDELARRYPLNGPSQMNDSSYWPTEQRK